MSCIRHWCNNGVPVQALKDLSLLVCSHCNSVQYASAICGASIHFPSKTPLVLGASITGLTVYIFLSLYIYIILHVYIKYTRSWLLLLLCGAHLHMQMREAEMRLRFNILHGKPPAGVPFVTFTDSRRFQRSRCCWSSSRRSRTRSGARPR